MRALRLMLATVGLMGGLIGIASAASASNVGNCSVVPVAPAGVTLAANGTRTSAAKANTVCGYNRQVRVEVQLWGDDAVVDNNLGGYTYWIDADGRGNFQGNRVNCDEDIGGDEIFTKARIGIPLGNGSYAWSSWDSGPTVSVSC